MELQTTVEGFVIEKQVEGFIPTIQSLEREQAKLKNDIAIFEAEYRESEAYKNYLKASRELSEVEAKELDTRKQARDLMIQSNLHDFTTMDGVKISLRKSPGSLQVDKEAEKNIPEKYWKISKSIDKTKLKQAYNDGEFYDDGVSINVDYTLQITYK